ncbi:hypothetical protein KZP23_08455 [Echinicola marina]|uniref:hypothetical protein n=1 Tax=Echinicola marina TaxID=2859768 RepID=UPI001CF64361|nr:hypothetical protein [Echinicola marina]UCS95025.1 hypothetical protein KZP23_08455 [Echinicola marina]
MSRIKTSNLRFQIGIKYQDVSIKCGEEGGKNKEERFYHKDFGGSSKVGRV